MRSWDLWGSGNVGLILPGCCGTCPGLSVPSLADLRPPAREILDFSHSWLLPVLQDHIRSARLGFFIHYFLPLAAALKGRGKRGTRRESSGSPPSARAESVAAWGFPTPG